MNDIDKSLEEVLKKVPQHTRLKRHAYTLLHHSTIKKLWNLMAIEVQRKLHRVKVSGYPYYLIIDPSNICNLRCPLCPTGLNQQGREKQLVGLEDFKKIIDRFYPYAYEVALHNWGESLLNPDIFKMIRYCADKNIGTNLSTNLNKFNGRPEQLIESGLEYLVLSLDGTTQEVYSRYRVGGDIETVFKNLKAIIEKKKEMKSRTPFIEWQFIVMKHNFHQIMEAQSLAKKVGVDLIRFIPVGLPFEAKNKKELAAQWFPFMPENGEDYREDMFLQKPISGGCFYMYRSVTINPLGAVAPCCVVWDKKDDFGNFFEEDFAEIWNNERYRSARAMFSASAEPTVKTICTRCDIFAKAEKGGR